ncbi:MAG: M28 family peptidase [Gemmatimonadetes bacterium]|nr:M28 family peptidase [Gemmatimonadota bacterium]
MNSTIARTLWAAGALALGASGLAAQTAASPASADRVLADIRYLADDAREGRGLGTAGLDSAASYIARQFQEAGLVPGGTDGFFQPLTIDSTAPILAHCRIRPAPVKNVIGVLPGTGRLAGQVVIVGGHYDHLGRGECSSLDPDSAGIVHNGADDNGSGTAGVMEIARLLRGRGQSVAEARAIVFVAFTAEELGALGSHYYVQHPVRPIDSTYVMINLDMVGRPVENRLIALGAASAVELLAVLDTANATYGLKVSGSGDGWGASDHAEFYAVRRPVLHFFTGIHSDYHKATDDWDKIDARGAASIAAYIADVAWKLATRPQPLTLVWAPRPQPVAGGGNRAYLGTLPDMSSTPGGVRISGVGPGSPAEAAGLKGGDILIRIGGREIKNLDDMQAALVEHRPGDAVDVVIRRGERTDTVKVTLGRRG